MKLQPVSEMEHFTSSEFLDQFIDFMNLPEEKQDELLPFCKWQPIEDVTIVE